MFESVLRQMRERIRKKEYVMTLHAEEEMDEDGLTIFDVEGIILTGEILERQRDPVTVQRKYRIQGETAGGDMAEIIAKLSPTGKLVLITVYAL